MTKYQVILNIDEKKVKEMAQDGDVLSAINHELGWTEQSGITVESVEEIEVEARSKMNEEEHLHSFLSAGEGEETEDGIGFLLKIPVRCSICGARATEKWRYLKTVDKNGEQV